MKNTLKLTILAIFSITSLNIAASETRSLDDNPWRYMNLELPLSWSIARWEAQRLNHVMEILLALEDCGCGKARAMLENDLRKYQGELKTEVTKLQEAESKGKIQMDITGLGKQDKLTATEALKRADQYWLSRGTRSQANQPD
jgi:hypothetical protein